MDKYKYPGFYRLEEDSPVKYALPLCDILRSFLRDRDFSYVSAAFYPLEMIELILRYLKYEQGIEYGIDTFSKNFLTEDSLCPIDTLLTLWGVEKFNKMIAELQKLADN